MSLVYWKSVTTQHFGNQKASRLVNTSGTGRAELLEMAWALPALSLLPCPVHLSHFGCSWSVFLSSVLINYLTWEGVMLLLLLLSRFSCVRLCATPQMAAHQAPPSLGFSRQERWSGLPFPSPMHESEKWKGSCSVVSDSSQPHGLQPTRLPRPWDSPSKNTGAGCPFLLQWIKVKSESEVAQSCLTLSDPMDWSPPGSSIHGIFQARVLEWGAIAFSKRGLWEPPIYSWSVRGMQAPELVTGIWSRTVLWDWALNLWGLY